MTVVGIKYFIKLSIPKDFYHIFNTKKSSSYKNYQQIIKNYPLHFMNTFLRTNKEVLMKKYMFILSVIFLQLSFTLRGYCFTIQKITDNSYDDLAPRVSDQMIAWYGGYENQQEIFYRIIGTDENVQVTYNNYQDYHVEISGLNMVWNGKVDEFQIFYRNGEQGQVLQVTDSNYGQSQPKISGDKFVWRGSNIGNSGHLQEIFTSYSGRITNNVWPDTYPEISGDNVVWVASMQSYEIFYNGIQLTSDVHEDDINPKIDKNIVVWQRFDGNDYEIFMFDGVTTRQLTDNEHNDTNPQISDGNITWCMTPKNEDSEIMYYDGENIFQLTDNNYMDADPQINGNKIVWSGNSDIFFFDGNSVSQITNNLIIEHSAYIYDSHIVWLGLDDNGTATTEDDDFEIFYVQTMIPEPSSILLLFIAAINLICRKKF